MAELGSGTYLIEVVVSRELVGGFVLIKLVVLVGFRLIYVL